MERKKILLILISLILLSAGIFLSSAESPALAKTEASRLVAVVDIDDMIINPIAYEVIAAAIQSAKEKNAQCLVIRMDTPGGLLETTHKIVKEIMNSPVPVVVYIWPQGARAASAGVFITLASHVAVMADSTHIGAAHPVIMNKSWGSIDEQMQEKVINDSTAWIESLAKARNRNSLWAKRAVTESVSITGKEALKLGVIDMIAKDLDELLAKLDKQTVETVTQKVTLRTKEAQVEFIGLTFRQRFLNNLINPNIAYILMMLGFFGLLYEITHPGFGFSGLAGIISLLLAFYAFQVLPTNYAGVFLVVLGISFFIIEAFTPAFGAFTLAGIVSLVFGSTILFNQPYEFLKVSLKIIIPVAVSLGLISTFLLTRIIKAHRRKAISGGEGLIGQTALARTDISPEGKVFIHGEIWDAQSGEKIRKGEKVVVEKVEGLKLTVKKSGGE
ncbi:MAG: nodulation protein NfeD [Candidatus Omnitrophica bacterium]|nr:nodulation protein NfeD [Candidatus Omnitrophota bacterium]